MLKKIIKIISIFILSLILLPALYMLIAYIFSHIQIEAKKESGKTISVYILTNGVHTDIVMPIKNDQYDWSKEIKFEYTKKKDSLMQFIAIGWGDKGFYLETPTWADLKFTTAFNAAFGLSNSAIHATFYKKIEESESCIKINISKKQYFNLIKYILRSLKKDKNGHFINIKTNANYGDNDAFYEAYGSYSLLHTCNTWTNISLVSCGQKACMWTPFDKGIFYQYNKDK
ncbi:MAG: TIGR02117 family protein [Bacteroidia bacterium]|nr:TIGR02117 family protein [Bacteroidia bacterium]